MFKEMCIILVLQDYTQKFLLKKSPTLKFFPPFQFQINIKHAWNPHFNLPTYPILKILLKPYHIFTSFCWYPFCNFIDKFPYFMAGT